ncbi:MAG: hypothetical protein JWO68_594 [Actinomycetia bacterium]|nr:hypothetical protein [Actinomycetes bacterium]
MDRLVDLIEGLHAALDRAGVPHAFGGALALAYGVANPRGTADIDVNLFVVPGRARVVFEALPPGVTWGDDDVARVERDGQVRVFWGRTPLDLFFNTAPFHENTARNAREVAFNGGTIRVLAPNDLAVFKAFFNRRQDWADLEAMAEVGSFDPAVVLGWLSELLGPDDERCDRLRQVVAEVEARGGEEVPFPRLPDDERA